MNFKKNTPKFCNREEKQKKKTFLGSYNNGSYNKRKILCLYDIFKKIVWLSSFLGISLIRDENKFHNFLYEKGSTWN